MSKRHNIAFLILLILGIIVFILACFQDNIGVICLAWALLGSVVFGWSTAYSYAASEEYYKKIDNLNEQEINLLKEELKQEKNYNREDAVQQAKLIATVITYHKAIDELLVDSPNNVKYANRWLVKGLEMKNAIDEAYTQNPAINTIELFDRLAKFEKEIEKGTVDIDRE